MLTMRNAFNIVILNVFCQFLALSYTQKSDTKFQTPNKTYVANDDKSNFFKNEQLIFRIPNTTLHKYSSYKDITILNFWVPADTYKVIFRFNAFENVISGLSGSCIPQNINIYLKPRSFPVVTPENVCLPSNFLKREQRVKSFFLELKSDATSRDLTVNGPLFGNWFAAAFIRGSDPAAEKIKQQGITATCETLLSAEMIVSKVDTNILYEGVPYKHSLSFRLDNTTKISNHTVLLKCCEHSNITANYSNQRGFINKLFTPQNVDKVKLNLTFLHSCDFCPDVGVFLAHNAIPISMEKVSEANNFVRSCTVTPFNSSANVCTFDIRPSSWYYLSVRYIRLENFNGNRKMATTFEQEVFINIEYVESNNFFIDDYNRTSNLENLYEQKLFKKGIKNSSYKKIKFYSLLRQSYGEFFMFDFDLVPDQNGTIPETVNITAGSPIGFMLDIGEIKDIGGTLSFAVSMMKNIGESKKFKAAFLPQVKHSESVAQKLIALPDLISPAIHENTSHSRNMSVIICIMFDEVGVPTWPNKCRYGNNLLPASAILQDTFKNDSASLVHIPYPESGIWFITIGVFCTSADSKKKAAIIEVQKNFIRKYSYLFNTMQSPCFCSNDKDFTSCLRDLNCLADLNETETFQIKECLLSSNCTLNYLQLENEYKNLSLSVLKPHLEAKECNASFIFSISSNPCVVGRCGLFGKCYHYMSGGFVFSTCVCSNGYKGWDCSNGNHLSSKLTVLVASISLVLSNLFFVPSIYVAFKRNYVSEALIFFFTMLFSSFYHACDAGEELYSFCIVKANVLQYCDFYCGLLSIWVTLISVAHLNAKVVSILHITGAVLLAVGTQLDKQSLWVFLCPASVGIIIIVGNWGFYRKRTKSWLPSKSYLTIYFPIGSFLAIAGLICYGFFQTKQNYFLVHSIWHILVALSIICLLPKRKV